MAAAPDAAGASSSSNSTNVRFGAIIGETNAGKSTLMNALTKADVLEEDKLFATLDPVGRKLWLAPGREFLLVDTVGFISRLPHAFVQAFRSTLEEVVYSDLILHVVDASDPDLIGHYDVVNSVFSEIGVKDIPILVVLNKCDLGDPVCLPDASHIVTISARTGEGIDRLKDKIALFFAESVIMILVLNGELAVPCDLQSATAGLTTRRGACYGKPATIRDVDLKVSCNFVL